MAVKVGHEQRAVKADLGQRGDDRINRLTATLSTGPLPRSARFEDAGGRS